MNKAERLWNLRDGVLAWLYGLRVDGAAIAEALPAPFMAATSWPDTEVTRVELNAAVEWLKDEGYVDGIGTVQGGGRSLLGRWWPCHYVEHTEDIGPRHQRYSVGCIEAPAHPGDVVVDAVGSEADRAGGSGRRCATGNLG